MATAVLIVTLLTVAASLASWLFSQWLARRARVSGAALALAGGGTVLLIGSVALVLVAASTGWVHFIPVQDFSMLEPAPMPARSTETAALEPVVEPVVEPASRVRFNEPKEGMLAAAERYLAQNEYAEAIGVARQYLVDQPADPEMRSMLARSLFAAEHPGSASLIPAVVVAQWPATDCVASMRSEESARWILDNGCGRVVAVLFASCQASETAC